MVSHPPLKEFLVCAYLGARFKARATGDPKVSYERQASELGMNKQNLMTLANGGTVGIQLLFGMAEKLFDGSFDAMMAAARNWWAELPEARREEVRAWASSAATRRPIKGSSARKLAEESASEAKSSAGDGSAGKRRGRAAVRGAPKGS